MTQITVLSLIHLLMGLKSGGYISTHFTHYNFPPFWDEHAIKDAPALWAGHSNTHIRRTVWGHLNDNGGSHTISAGGCLLLPFLACLQKTNVALDSKCKHKRLKS